MTTRLFSACGPECTNVLGPRNLIRYADEYVSTYTDFRNKHPFPTHFASRTEFVCTGRSDAEAAVTTLWNHRAAEDRLVVVGGDDEALEWVVEATANEKPIVYSFSGRANRPGVRRARAWGLSVAEWGRRSGGLGPDGDYRTERHLLQALTTFTGVGSADSEDAFRNRPHVVSVHLDVLDPSFAPAAGGVVGGGWSTRFLICAVRSVLRDVPWSVFELCGYNPRADREDLTLYAGAAVLQAVIEAGGC